MAFGAILGQRPGVQSVNNVLPDVQGNVTLNAGNVGAAPAGYGLGANAVSVDSWDNATKNGFYKSNKGTPDGDGNYWHGIVVNYSGVLCNQLVWKTWGTGSVMATRRINNSIPEEWEWLDPPMSAGVEYRTTERWSGQVVYTKLVSCGTAINDATVTLEGVTACVRFIGYLSYPNESVPRKQLPIWSGSTIGTGYHAEITQSVPASSVNQFIIKTDRNRDGFGNGGYNWWVHVWYTKD